jgi:folate-binding protein YgfZ
MKSALLNLSARGRIKVSGEDRARLLHAMTTNHVQNLQPGSGLYAFFLNAQGRIQADAVILCFDDYFLLDTEPETRALVLEHLDRFIIADDVTLEDVTESTFCLAHEGTSSDLAPFTHTTEGDITTAAVSFTGLPALRYYGPLEAQPSLVARLTSEGATPATLAEAETARIRNFKPRFGPDITSSTLPQETQMMHALHFQKGCYLGQEIVERVRSRGHVNKTLMGFHFTGDTAPAASTSVTADGKETGEVTSAVATPDGVYGLAFVRIPHNKPGSTVTIAGQPAELFLPATPERVS